MSLRKLVSAIAFSVAGLLIVSSTAYASIIHVDVSSGDTDSIAVSGSFDIDTSNVEGYVVSDWSLDVTVLGDPALNMLNSFSSFTQGATSATISFTAFTGTSACDPSGNCVQSLQLTTAPINPGPAGGSFTITQVGPVSACVSFVSVVPSNCVVITNSMTSSVSLVATTSAAPAVPEPSGIALFSLGMLAICPVLRRRQQPKR